MNLTLPPDFWQYLISAAVLLVTQYLASRFGIKLPVITPPAPQPAEPVPQSVPPVPDKSPALLPAGGGLLIAVLAAVRMLAPLLAPLLAKGELTPEEQVAVKTLRHLLPEEKK